MVHGRRTPQIDVGMSFQMVAASAGDNPVFGGKRRNLALSS